MLITRSDDGYFGLRQSLAGVFDKAVSSGCGNAFEEHGLTEDGKTVAPIIEAFCSRSMSADEAQTSHPQFVLSHNPYPSDSKSSRNTKKQNVSNTEKEKDNPNVSPNENLIRFERGDRTSRILSP